MLNALQRGVTLVELLIGLTIVGVLLAMGAPSFSSWVQNTQIRTATEAVLNGLQLARAEAVRRNTLISFQLVTTLDSSCTLLPANTTDQPANWVVSLVASPSSLTSVAGACDKSPANPPEDIATPADPADPYIVQKRPSGEGSRNAKVQTSQSQITFNGLGRVTPAVLSNIAIDISNPTSGACKTSSTAGMRCLQVQISPGGQVRMCDPSLIATDPNYLTQGCLP